MRTLGWWISQSPRFTPSRPPPERHGRPPGLPLVGPSPHGGRQGPMLRDWATFRPVLGPPLPGSVQATDSDTCPFPGRFPCRHAHSPRTSGGSHSQRRSPRHLLRTSERPGADRPPRSGDARRRKPLRPAPGPSPSGIGFDASTASRDSVYGSTGGIPHTSCSSSVSSRFSRTR
jgi:hypothetical protein